MPLDLFVSYSRRDNEQGRVTELVRRLEADFLDRAKQGLRCFFDVESIEGMEDWRHRILGGLRESQLLLLVLSPAYLASDYCQWEIVEYLKYEYARLAAGQGVAPVYFVEIPGLDSPDFEARAAAWVARVRRRNHFDLRPWYDEGAEALKRLDMRRRLEDLGRSIHERVTRLRRLAETPGNLPAHNPHFVGRQAEMERLHDSAGLGRFGVLTTVQGLGGLGKTALAVQYASAYADFYPGGCWHIGCAGVDNLAAAVATLDVDLGLTLTDEDKRDEVRAAGRVLAEIERRARRGAEARAGERNPPAPRALLLLDNVESPALLQPPQTDLLSGRDWLHVLATTRLTPREFGHDPARQTLLTVDELPVEDGVRLIEDYQPDRRFPSESERRAATEIVELLGGFTLAVEVVAIYLNELAGRVTCAEFLERLRREGLAGLDEGVAKVTQRSVPHREKLISATLGPTLDLLRREERFVLACAAVLPADTIPLPWLRALAAKVSPALATDAAPGHPDPWLDGVVNHLLGLRLLQVVADEAEQNASAEPPPLRMVRMHRLAQQEVLRQLAGAAPGNKFPARWLLAHLMERCGFLEEGWLQPGNRWEIPPLRSAAHAFLDRDPDSLDAALVANNVAVLTFRVGEYGLGESLCRRALAARERVLGPEHPDTLGSVSNLAYLLRMKGDYGRAEPLYERALAAGERVLGPDHPFTLTSVNNLAGLLEAEGECVRAEPLYERALETRERVLGPEHPDTLRSANNLAHLLKMKGEYGRAETLYQRALATRERILGPEHPDTLQSLNNLGHLLKTKGDYGRAEPLYRRALKAFERVLGPEHRETLTSVNNLAMLLLETDRPAQAEPLMRRVVEFFVALSRSLGHPHPDLRSVMGNYSAVLQATGRSREEASAELRALAPEFAGEEGPS